MASPHFNNVDETNGRLPVVDDITALRLQAGGYPGRVVWVQSLRQSYFLDPFSTETDDGYTIVTCTSGGTWRANMSRADWLMARQGLVAETCSRVINVSTRLLIDGTVYLMAVFLEVGRPVTNLSIHVGAAAVTASLSKVGLYDKTGTRLALSADQGAAWETTGMKTIALISAYTPTVRDVYYAAIVGKAGTLPSVAVTEQSTTSGVGLVASINSGVMPCASLVTQTDLPTSLTVAAGTAPHMFWMAMS